MIYDEEVITNLVEDSAFSDPYKAKSFFINMLAENYPRKMAEIILERCPEYLPDILGNDEITGTDSTIGY